MPRMPEILDSTHSTKQNLLALPSLTVMVLADSGYVGNHRSQAVLHTEGGGHCWAPHLSCTDCHTNPEKHGSWLLL